MRAAGFAGPEPPATPAALKSNAFVLYLCEHAEMRIRKIGITRTRRLELWRQRGWTVLETIEHPDAPSMIAAEALALLRLDQYGARASKRMEALFPNLDRNGRPEMYDPLLWRGGLASLLSERVAEAVGHREPIAAPWVTESRSHAATKAMKNRDARHQPTSMGYTPVVRIADNNSLVPALTAGRLNGSSRLFTWCWITVCRIRQIRSGRALRLPIRRTVPAICDAGSSSNPLSLSAARGGSFSAWRPRAADAIGGVPCRHAVRGDAPRDHCVQPCGGGRADRRARTTPIRGHSRRRAARRRRGPRGQAVVSRDLRR